MATWKWHGSAKKLDEHLIHIATEVSKRFETRSVPRSVNTVNRHKVVYRSFFKWCFRKNLIKADLSSEIHLSKQLSNHAAPITLEEVKRLIEVISKSNDPFAERDKVLFSIYAFSGIRKSEALVLRVSDYDPRARSITICSSKGHTHKSQPIPKILSSILDHYLKDKIPSAPLIYGQRDGAFLSPRQASNRFEKWKKLAKLRNNLTIHSFRAGYASQLYKSSKDPLLVSHAMGHSSFSTTEKYIKHEFGKLRASLEMAFPKKKTQ